MSMRLVQRECKSRLMSMVHWVHQTLSFSVVTTHSTKTMDQSLTRESKIDKFLDLASLGTW